MTNHTDNTKSLTSKADARRFMSMAREMPDKYLSCRDRGHNWDTKVVEKFDGYWKRQLTCNTSWGGCGATRTEWIDDDGVIESRQYRYPEGYQMSGSGRTMQRANFRSILFERHWSKV